MASIKLYVPQRDAERPDGLCPKCFNPSLKRYTLTLISMDGLTPLGDRVACRDCNVWTTKLEPYKETA